MAYTPYYSNGWQNGEQGGTPITAAALNHMEGGIEDNADAIDAINSKLDGAYVTASNSTNGITARLFYLKAAPNIMCLRITGTTTVELGTSAGYASLWNANTFLTNAVGTRNSAIIKYVVSGNYKYQFFVESGGLIKIGYSNRLSDNAAVNIPSGTSLYIEEVIFVK